MSSLSNIQINIQKVRDVMTRGSRIITCKAETTVEEALEKMVNYRVSGFPVLDSDEKVIGVVSDFDLLSLDDQAFVTAKDSLFPEADDTWEAFRLLKKMQAKVGGRTVGDVMTTNPIVVGPDSDVHNAISLLIKSKIQRLIVVDSDNRLVGLFSRRNVARALLAQIQSVKNMSPLQ